MITDLLIIGGGINGCGVAADAAGRGLSVILCEKDDLAFATSSASSKLIHGGLRYLEQYDFKLVRDALKEREILMAKAPFLIHLLPFVLPNNKHIRSALMIRFGLLLYDRLYTKHTVPSSKKLNLHKVAEGKPIKKEYRTGFRYFDCFTDDARLVILNALAAKEKKAHILTRTHCESLQREKDYWIVQLHDQLHNQKIKIKAKAIVNAAGPWVLDIINNLAHTTSSYKLRLVQGSHIVVRKLYKGQHAYTLQNPDGRVVFTIPFKKKFTLIGTTDVPYEGNPNLVSITNHEIDYLCNTINQYFSRPIDRSDILWSYSGVRALFDDKSMKPSEVTREYHLDLNQENDLAPMLSIFGGKITTYRVLAEKVMDTLKPYFPNMGPAWTKTATLPGGDCDGKNITEQYTWLPIEIMHRYAETYGNRCHVFLSECHALEDLGQYFGAGLYEKEVDYLIKNEWAQTVDDILWRRTKLGLYLTENEINILKVYLGNIGLL